MFQPGKLTELLPPDAEARGVLVGDEQSATVEEEEADVGAERPDEDGALGLCDFSHHRNAEDDDAYSDPDDDDDDDEDDFDEKEEDDEDDIDDIDDDDDE